MASKKKSVYHQVWDHVYVPGQFRIGINFTRCAGKISLLPALDHKNPKQDVLMEMIKRVLKVVYILVALLFVMNIFRASHQAYFETDTEYIQGGGNVPEDVRAEIIAQLEKFQAGYTARDLDQVDAFMANLF